MVGSQAMENRVPNMNSRWTAAGFGERLFCVPVEAEAQSWPRLGAGSDREDDGHVSAGGAIA